MEKRNHKRIKVNLKAERISGNGNHCIFIENISEHGICMLTSPSDDHKKYTPGADVELRFNLGNGTTIDLRCKTRWAYYKMPPEKETDSIGLEIIDPPAQYIKFVKSLS